MSDVVRRTVVVLRSQQLAFDLFTTGLSTWWPREYTWSGDVLEMIGIEARHGGHCYERGPGGFECDWGSVVVWEPPHRLVFLWQIAPDRVPQPDPSKASEVEVRFIAMSAEETRVELEHRAFHRHGERGVEYSEAMDSEHGWTEILARYVTSSE
jgi:uncharacterized protein YndB with AHSA1/START domain